ncbi:MAG: class I adenylate cyclase, partial [Gammaproteobacteria bacterium]
MVDKINLDQGLGRKEIKQILRRFNALNAHRIKRLEADMSSIQKDFLTILPLLFHINYPTLPGFVSNDVPAGVAEYHPDRKALLIAKKFGRSFEYKRKALRTIPIQGLYLMGSIGSVGQTPDSDLDFWLCHSHDLTRKQIRLLEKKAQLIEEFGMEHGLEVHFFLMDAVAFKSGQTLSLSSESSGSAQHYLLLEEFYRTSILISGRPPMWWIVPPEEEHCYQSFTDEMIKKRFIDPIDWIDFGGMNDVPAEEFFGAAHWQLYKGIESPYKAILKILLMESYAADFPKIKWLSQVTKKGIFSGDENVTDIDPYILIYR